MSIAIGWILQDLHTTCRESSPDGNLHLPTGILGMGVFGEGRDQEAEEWCVIELGSQHEHLLELR